MGMIFKDVVGIIDRTKKFDSCQEIEDPNNWSFKYITQNTETTASDITIDGGEPDTDKSHYPEGTIFFDSGNYELYINSTAETIVIDNTPPTLKKAYIQYLTVNQDHKCEFVFNSDTPLDVKNIEIKCGELTLYKADRKAKTIEYSSFIYDLVLNKSGNNYTLSFFILDNSAVIELLNNNPLEITVYDIAGNCCSIEKTGTWISIDSDEALDQLQQLEVIFTKYTPEDRIINEKVEGEATVLIYNPNRAYWSVQPHVELTEESVGYLDPDTISFNKNDGTLTFKVTNITEKGYIYVHTWLAVENQDIADVIKNSTEATGELGPWIATEDGRLYNFEHYVPNYIQDEHYRDFVNFVQTFLNTCFESLDTGNNISVLEKIARINNFNDIQAIEKKLIDQYRTTYNVEVNPSLEDLKVYLDNKTVNVETTYTSIIDNDESNVTENSDGTVKVTNTDSEDTVETITEVKTESAYKNPLTLDDVNEMMRYVYKNIPYYNQIKGTRNGIKMILNTMGLCVKLVEVWSEHRTVSNAINDNIERRADELQAEIYEDDYDSIDIDIGKFYLTSRFDIDLGQTDLTFRQFNDLAKNIVNIIFQVKPVTRVLRKLSYIFSTNVNLHFKYFNLVDANIHQYYCYNYLWDLFDDYSMSKSIHDIYAKSCNKLFVPFKAKHAEVTYLAMANHDQDYTSNKLIANGKFGLDCNNNEITTRGTLMTRKASTNTFHNLCNFEHKFNISHQTVLHLNFAYIEKVKVTTVEKIDVVGEDLPQLTVDSSYKIYCNGTVITNAEIDEFGNIVDVQKVINDNDSLVAKYNLYMPNQAKVTSETNGFIIDFDRASVALLRKTKYRDTLNEQLKEVKQLSETKVETTEIEPIGLFLQMKFAIPLGTKFIAQYTGSGENIQVYNPDDNTLSDTTPFEVNLCGE